MFLMFSSQKQEGHHETRQAPHCRIVLFPESLTKPKLRCSFWCSFSGFLCSLFSLVQRKRNPVTLKPTSILVSLWRERIEQTTLESHLSHHWTQPPSPSSLVMQRLWDSQCKGHDREHIIRSLLGIFFFLDMVLTVQLKFLILLPRPHELQACATQPASLCSPQYSFHFPGEGRFVYI